MKLENLSFSQREELERYFNGERKVDLETVKGGKLSVDGDFSREVKTGASLTNYAVGGQKFIQSSSEFKFAGISITKTKVSGSYNTEPGVGATQILSHQCTVEHNYQPLTKVNTQKGDAYANGGEATFLCSVEVTRGVPTPWGDVNWSTRNATQGVVGNGDGVVVKEGWM